MTSSAWNSNADYEQVGVGDRVQNGKNDVVGVVGPKTFTDMILACEVEPIRGFLAHLADCNYSTATMARKIATLRSFHKWLDRIGCISRNPMTVIRTPRQSRRLPKAITVQDVEQLLAAPEAATLLGCRDRAMLETLYSTGIRVSELVGIDMARHRRSWTSPDCARQGPTRTNRPTRHARPSGNL